jgi:hypothetical protein
MADWKQITARIRRARTSKDPVGQLSNLFEKTRDAMVAFELARHLETSGQNAEAAKWYSAAAERFRRADWKTKAQDAITRLGGVPAGESVSTESEAGTIASAPAVVPEPALALEENAEVSEPLVANDASAEKEEAPTRPTSAPVVERGRRRRGRRGGRNRRKGGAASEKSSTTSAAQTAEPVSSPGHRSSTRASVDEPPVSRFAKAAESPALRLPVEPTATDSGGIALRGRYGDPGLSSRLSLLEMQFRRLLTCAPVKLDQADSAPAGPGVFLLSDSDLTSYYYVEACQTLRIAIPNLLRGGSTRRGADSIKPQLAQHLGIPDARVGKYLADHCVVRWLQLDEGASHFAHFVTAVLRPILNE